MDLLPGHDPGGLQKVRRARSERIRGEAHARPNQVMQVREFLHPQIDEITDTMPTWLGARVRRSRWFQRVVHAATHKGMILNTASITGYTLLMTTARMRPLRPRSLRFASARGGPGRRGWRATLQTKLAELQAA